MKKISFIYLALVASSLFVACQSSDLAIDNSESFVGKEVMIKPVMPGQTRLNTEGTGGWFFSQGDVVAVSKDFYSKYATYIANDPGATSWSCNSTYRLTWGANLNQFQGWYPVYDSLSNIIGNSFTHYDLIMDQSNTRNLRMADYLRVDTVYETPQSVLELEFAHQLAKIKIHIVGWGTQFVSPPMITDVRVRARATEFGLNPAGTAYDWHYPTTFAPTDPHRDYSVSCDTTSYPVSSNPGILLYGSYGYYPDYVALVPPADQSSSTPFIYFYLNGDTVNPIYVKGYPELKAGNEYHYDVWVGHDEILVANVTVTPWEMTPEISAVASPGCQVGDYLCDDGSFSKTYVSNAVALVYAVTSSLNSDILDQDPNTVSSHGRAVALYDACIESQPTSLGSMALSQPVYWASSPYSIITGSLYASTISYAEENFNGWKNTETMIRNALSFSTSTSGPGPSGFYTFVQNNFPALFNSTNMPFTNPYSPSTTTMMGGWPIAIPTDPISNTQVSPGWYLLSAGELKKIYNKFSYMNSLGESDIEGFLYLNGNTYKDAIRNTTRYWSSTAYNTKAYYVDMLTGDVGLDDQEAHEYLVRPGISF